MYVCLCGCACAFACVHLVYVHVCAVYLYMNTCVLYNIKCVRISYDIWYNGQEGTALTLALSVIILSCPHILCYQH